MLHRGMVIGLVLVLLPNWSMTAELEQVNKLINQIKAVSKEGKGNNEAKTAWKELIQLGPDALMPTIAALGDASPIAENWFRTAIDALTEKEKQAKRTLPKDKLEAYLKEVKNPPVSRRLVYELLVQVDPKTPDRLLESMIDDPQADLRRDAIAASLEKVKPLIDTNRELATKQYQRLFEASRDHDQAESIAKSLHKLGVLVDLTDHYNVIWKWMVVGPFDSTDGKGYRKPYEPETKVDLNASYKGKNGQEVKWKTYWSFDPYGVVDLNEALGKHKDSAAYAYAAIESSEARDVEIRLGSIVAVEVFLNGKKIFEREEYHHGDRPDQYIAKGSLKKGKNEILVKILQNNQQESWAQVWNFQLRICDATGGKVPFKLLTAQ